MAINKLDDVRLNVKPMFIKMYHEYAFEGPCRFGEGVQLTKEFDLNMAEEKYKSWIKQLKDAMPEDCVNLMEPVVIERDEQFLTTDEALEKLAVDHENVDLYWVGYASRPYDIVLEFAQRYKIPMAITQACCASAITSAECLSRGLEFYSFEAWEDATEYMTVLRARKAIAEMKVLCATRMTSTVSVSSPDSIIDPEKLTEKFGTRFRYVSAHELLDQMSYDDPMENHCTPGRKGLNFDDEDAKEIDRITDDLVGGAGAVEMDKEMVKKSVEAYYSLVQKLLAANECNAFTANCPDACSTCRINKERFTFCITHSLNNEQGIPSACEYDIAAAVSKAALQAIASKPSYMGNTAVLTLPDGTLTEDGYVQHFSKDHVGPEKWDALRGTPNIVMTQHSVGNRKMKGFDEEDARFAIRPFAYSGFGVTMRRDFDKDAGQVITMCRISPNCDKLFVAKGTVVDGIGFKDTNCSEGVFFQVKDSKDFFKKQAAIGNHMPLIYGDFEDQVIELGELLGLEIVQA